MNENRWKYIPDGTIDIDFSDCKYVSDLHKKLEESFGFPEYYGRNWDALWDCLRDFAMSETKQRTVVIRGIDKLPQKLREFFQNAIIIFDDLEQKYPIVHFIIKD